MYKTLELGHYRGKGMTISEIASTNRSYLNWCLRNCNTKDALQIKKDIRICLESIDEPDKITPIHKDVNMTKFLDFKHEDIKKSLMKEIKISSEEFDSFVKAILKPDESVTLNYRIYELSQLILETRFDPHVKWCTDDLDNGGFLLKIFILWRSGISPKFRDYKFNQNSRDFLLNEFIRLWRGGKSYKEIKFRMQDEGEYFIKKFGLCDFHCKLCLDLKKKNNDPDKQCDDCRRVIKDVKNLASHNNLDFIISNLGRMIKCKEILYKIIQKFYKIRRVVPLWKQCDGTEILFRSRYQQFKLLNVTDKQIKRLFKCREDRVMSSLPFSILEDTDKGLDNFYIAFLHNPYAFYTLELEKADEILKLTGKNKEDYRYERHLGEISRYIYKCAVDYKWTGVPYNKLPYAHKHKDTLNRDYGLYFDDTTQHVYIKHIRHEEEYVASFCKQQIRMNNSCNPDFKHGDIPSVDGYQLSDEQKDAIINSLNKTLSMICGPAGTGKTSVIGGIVKTLESKTKTYCLCAFTAKACVRIKQVACIDVKNVKTIHSLIMLLKLGSELPNYIIIDEASTINLNLLYRLILKLMNKNVNIIMLGDYNQCPPIKYGRPFEDIVTSDINEIPISKLTKNWRVKNGADDPIIVNSNNIINSNRGPYRFEEGDNFKRQFMNKEDLKYSIGEILTCYNINIDNIGDNKFIATSNKNCTILNKIISENLNGHEEKKIELRFKDSKKKREITNPDLDYELIIFHVNDPVIFIKNDVYDNVKNGDEGKIIDIEQDIIKIKVNSKIIDVKVEEHDDTHNKCKYKTVKYVHLAYAINTYKSQGSEYKNVYYYITPSEYHTNKRNTYTSITRAKNSCLILETGGGEIFTRFSNEEQPPHYGGLIHRLEENKIYLPTK